MYMHKVATIAKLLITKLVDVVFLTTSILFIIYIQFLDPHEISGDSMMPNLLNGEIILTVKPNNKFIKTTHSKIIVFRPKGQESCKDCEYVKRIIGMPGDVMNIKNNQIYINNQNIKENYLSQALRKNQYLQDKNIRLSNSQYYVLGDNRNNSLDSRDFGPIEKTNILGIAVMRIWPLQKIEFF